nr:hypothetical transcript [Hymenolepis microstoma]
MSNFKLFVLFGLVCATLAHNRGHYKGHRDEHYYDEPHDSDWYYDMDLPEHHTWRVPPEAPMSNMEDFTGDPDKSIMTLEERQPVKKSIRIRNKQRVNDPKYQKGLQELAGLM